MNLQFFYTGYIILQLQPTNDTTLITITLLVTRKETRENVR